MSNHQDLFHIIRLDSLPLSILLPVAVHQNTSLRLTKDLPLLDLVELLHHVHLLLLLLDMVKSLYLVCRLILPKVHQLVSHCHHGLSAATVLEVEIFQASVTVRKSHILPHPGRIYLLIFDADLRHLTGGNPVDLISQTVQGYALIRAFQISRHRGELQMNAEDSRPMDHNTDASL